MSTTPEAPPPSPTAPPGGPSGHGETPGAAGHPPPRLAEGIELVGLFEDSGFKDPPYIARRGDGQVVQLPRLLYAVAEHVDGRRGHGEIAERVTEAFGRRLEADDIGFLLEEKLRPLGVIAAPDGSSPQMAKLDPLLALKFRTGVIPERVVNAITTVFRPAFFPPVVVAVLAGLVALDVWLFFVHGISQSVRAAIYQPLVLLLILGGVVVATALHEIGHATACRYGGAKPGVMGVGIYVVWPAFFTDVTDAYRLDRAGRLRTDLGGIYFNAIFALLVAGIYFLTGFEPLLLLVLLQHFAILQQLLPLLRLDGYYIISDLTGVPDMFSRVRPTLASLLPGRPVDERVAELKPRARRVVVTYVLVTVPLLALATLLMLAHAPRAFATAYDSLGLRYDRTAAAFGEGNPLSGIAGILQMGALVLPLAGMVLTTGRVGRRVGGAAWSWSADEPLRRAAVLVPAAGALGLAAFLWWPNGDYKPIQPSERGTVQAGLSSLRAIPTGRPALTPERERELRGAPGLRESQEPDRPAGDERERRPADDSQTPTTPSQEPQTQTTTEPGATPPAPAPGSQDGGAQTTPGPLPGGSSPEPQTESPPSLPDQETPAP